jgi:glycosyltransferase involved in cell wall biosynthesis
MNIVIYDPYVGKFTTDMQAWWEKQGHQVKRSTYYDPSLVEWADVLWFETTDNNILSATNPSEALLADDANYKPWRLQDYDLSRKKVIVRMIDIEVWQQHYMAPKWGVVDDIIFIAPHIRNLVDQDTLPEFNPEKTNIHIIPCAVDLDRWTYKERGPGKDIAVVSEKWSSKGTHEVLQVALTLKQRGYDYKIHWLGKRSDSNWEYAYFDEFVEHHQLNIEFTNMLQDNETVDDFLEGKNYLLHGSIKEGFSYATAEAMAKGIKPVVHRFYGADALWPGLTWDTIDEAVQMITGPNVEGTSSWYKSEKYRQYLINHRYTLPQMMESIDKIINSKE